MRFRRRSCSMRAVVRELLMSDIELSNICCDSSEKLLLLLQEVDLGGDTPAIADVCTQDEVRDGAATPGKIWGRVGDRLIALRRF